MIKEKKKKSKYVFYKTKSQILLEYFRTVFFSVLLAFIITSSLAMHARNEMIKDISNQHIEQEHLDKQIAIKLIEQTDLLEDLQTKKYSICMHVGNLFESAGDYKDAQLAYEMAVEKSHNTNYKSHLKLIEVLVAQEKFDEANAFLDSIKDFTDKDLIKFKTRSNIVIGDKYYSIGKFLSAAKKYENADFYYNKFSKKDKKIDESIKKRIVNAYIQTADIMVKSGYNSDGVRFLKKAEQYAPDDFQIRYKLAIILTDLDPEKALEYFTPLLEEIPQDIDYNVYNTALMKSANIAELRSEFTKAKYYRYKIHSTDLFLERKVVYKDDIETLLKSFIVKKSFFTYPIKPTFIFNNVSNKDIINLKGDFILTNKDKELEKITLNVANKNNPLLSYNDEPNEINIKFQKKVYTKRELENYTIKIYLYKDEKFKTLVAEVKVPQSSYQNLF